MLETFEQLASLTLANDSRAAPTVKVDVRPLSARIGPEPIAGLLVPTGP